MTHSLKLFPYGANKSDFCDIEMREGANWNPYFGFREAWCRDRGSHNNNFYVLGNPGCSQDHISSSCIEDVLERNGRALVIDSGSEAIFNSLGFCENIVRGEELFSIGFDIFSLLPEQGSPSVDEVAEDVARALSCVSSCEAAHHKKDIKIFKKALIEIWQQKGHDGDVSDLLTYLKGLSEERAAVLHKDLHSFVETYPNFFQKGDENGWDALTFINMRLPDDVWLFCGGKITQLLMGFLFLQAMAFQRKTKCRAPYMILLKGNFPDPYESFLPLLERVLIHARPHYLSIGRFNTCIFNVSETNNTHYSDRFERLYRAYSHWHLFLKGTYCRSFEHNNPYTFSKEALYMLRGLSEEGLMIKSSQSGFQTCSLTSQGVSNVTAA